MDEIKLRHRLSLSDNNENRDHGAPMYDNESATPIRSSFYNHTARSTVMSLTRRFRSQRPIWLVLTCLLGFLYFFGHDIRSVACAFSSPVTQHSLCASGYQDGDWDLFYHLGGNGPWIPKAEGLGHPDDPLPKGCAVDQVHLVCLAFIHPRRSDEQLTYSSFRDMENAFQREMRV